MLKNKLLLGIILSIILIVFGMPGLTAYYKYTQESGANFYVGTGDKADALEDTNEMRQIIDDLGALLVHSKRDDAYPKNGLFGGTIQIPEAGLKFSNDPVNNDIAAYIAGEMTWQTKAELGIDLSLYYLKTEMDSFSEIQAIIADKTLVNVEDGITATAIQDDLILKADFADEDWGDMTVATNVVTVDSGAITYAKIQNVSATDKILGRFSAGAGVIEEIVCTSAGRDLIDDANASAQRTTLGIDLSLYYLKTEIDTLGEVETIYTKDITDSDELATALTNYYLKTAIDTLGEVETIYTKDIIDSDELAALDYRGKNYYSALGSDHTYSDNADLDSQPVGESVVFGDLLYPDWTAGEWLKVDADLAAKMPGLRIALESKSDGQTCLMLVKGYIRDDSAFEFTASMVYANVTPGAMSSTAPTETGDQLQRLGIAKSADILFFDPSIDVAEIK